MLKLSCTDCGKHMGEIMDGRVRNGMAVRCAPCERKLQIQIASSTQRAHSGSSEGFDDFFMDMLRNAKKR